MDGSMEYPLVNPNEMAGEAWAAMHRRDENEALRLWQQLRREFPDRPEGYIWPIQVLWQGGRLDEADTMAAGALARFPENPDVLVQHGWIAAVREHWEEALRWWAAVRKRAPDRLDGYLWATRALWKLARFAEAETMAAEAMKRFPGNADVEAERAWIAVNRSDWPAALDCWKQVLDIEPDRGEAQVGLIQAMRFAGKAAEAEAAAAKALAGRPDDPHLLVEHIWTAADRADWPAATARLEAARETLRMAGLFQATSDAVEARRKIVLARAGSAGAATAAGGPVDQLSADLMLSFEGIGERCDLGAVQRHYGAEPMGLLRFAFSPFDGLISALQDRFDAIGSEEDTGFEVYQDETILTTRKYGLAFHTFILKSDTAVSFLDGKLEIWRLNTPKKRDAFHEQQLNRLIMLKRKLITDLEESRKIFVYSSDERTSEDDAARLLAALRAYGPNALLYVRPASTAHPEGTVTTLQDGLYLGHYPGLTDFVAGQQPAFGVWHQLLQRAYEFNQKSLRPRR